MKKKKSIFVNRLIKILKLHNNEIRQGFKVKEIGIFGSYIKGEQGRGSDIDILVEFEQGYKTFDNYMELKFLLEKIFGSKVDLVIKSALRREIKEYVLADTIYV